MSNDREAGRSGDDRVESALVRRAQRGDVAAFTELYRRHSRWVFGVALRIVGNPSDAEDITQDTFIQVWKALARFRYESELRTWIHRICVNRCLRVGAKRSASRTEDLPDDLVSTTPDPASVAAVRGEMAEVQRAIATLPDGQRTALVLREFGGLTYDEVAAALGISLTAARARIHRGRLEVVNRLDSSRLRGPLSVVGEPDRTGRSDSTGRPESGDGTPEEAIA